MILNIAQQALKREGEAQLSHMERSAVLALCKITCVSKDLCQEHIPLIFGLLMKPNLDKVTRANIIVSVGDIYQRHANTVEDQVKKLYQILHETTEDSVLVRRQALLVIIHLILNGMLKLRGEIVDILMLLLDPDEQIRNQVMLFLSEVNAKDSNLIYNLFPKAIHRLSIE